MISLKAAREHYHYNSGKAGDVARQLAFAGFAVIWLFHITVEGKGPALPQQFLLPVSLLVASLAFDLLQYTWATVVWGVFQYRTARTVKENLDGEVRNAPGWFTWGNGLFFWAKLSAVVVGYAYLFTAIRHLVE